MKKKVISIMLVGAMVASMGAMAGCGNSAPAPSAPADGSAPAEAPADAPAAIPEGDENTLSVYAWDKNFNIPALEAAEKAYQEVNPDFKLNIIEQANSGDVETAITTAASAGNYETLPDIVLFQDHYIQNYVSNYPDAWQNLDGVDVDWSQISEEKLSYSTIDGVHYGAPVDNGACIAAYRTDCLEAAGYTIDDLTGCSWDEFIEIGKAVYDATGKYLLCMDGDGNDLFYLMGQAEGISQFKDGAPYITENEKLVKITEIMAEMATNNVLYLANSWSDYTDQAIQGDMVAGVINGNWIIPTMKQVEANSGKWAITSMPTIAGGEGYASNGGSSLYITANCANADLAKDFLAYTFCGGEGATATYNDALINGGVIGCWAGASGAEAYQAPDEFFGGQAIYADIVEMGTHVPVIEQNDFHYSCRTYMATAMINITQNGYSVADALQEAEDNLKFEMGM